jgi:hypothetical protein
LLYAICQALFGFAMIQKFAKKKTLVSVKGDFLPNFDLKNMILTPYEGIFHGKNRPIFKKKNSKIP